MTPTALCSLIPFVNFFPCPDLVVINKLLKAFFIVDITVAFENGPASFAATKELKIEKYYPLKNELLALGFEVFCNAVIIGALGAWHHGNDEALKQLGITGSTLKALKTRLVADSIAWFRDIYFHHITGFLPEQPIFRSLDGSIPDIDTLELVEEAPEIPLNQEPEMTGRAAPTR